MTRSRMCVRIAAIFVASAMIAACGCTQPYVDPLVPQGPAIVWPKPPDPPRVRYLGALIGEKDLRPAKPLSQQWDELLHGPKPPTAFVSPHAVAVHADGQRVAVADTTAGCVHVFDLLRHVYQVEALAGNPPRRIDCPVAVAWVGDTIWAADAKLHAVAVFGDGAGRWVGEDLLKRPAGLACNPQGEAVYVTDAGGHEVLVFNPRGQLVHRFGTQGAEGGQFNYPSHIACGPDGTLVVADTLNFRVQRLSPEGTPLNVFGRKGDAAGDLALPKGVAVDAGGRIWVVDAHFENVQAFTPEGQLLLALGGEGHGPGEFWLPAGACIDRRGRLWVADTYNQRVQVFELIEP
jgi:DNA-binding beta-propeller fold protein YncE